MEDMKSKLKEKPGEGAPVDAKADIFVAKDEMSAVLHIAPPQNGGEMLTAEKINAVLARAGVTFGIDTEAIECVCAGTRTGEVTVALGRPPVNGEDGWVEFHFRQVFSNAPKILENGKVDYRNIDSMEVVKRGQLLATLHPLTTGEAGTTVRGRPVKAKPGKLKLIPAGRNTEISSDGLTLTAGSDGVVEMAGNKITVLKLLRIQGDVASATGNIDFPGDVVINGNVISQYSVKATGNIEVMGTVEDAIIEAGGNIILRQGVHGMHGGRISAKGKIVARFIENATVFAKGTIEAEIITHSQVQSNDKIIVSSRKGMISGGAVRAANDIVADITGTQLATATLLEVGVSPEVRNRVTEIEKELKKHDSDLNRISLVGDRLEQLEHRGQLDEATILKKREFIRQKLLLKDAISKLSAEYNELKEVLNGARNGRIHVRDIAHPGTILVMGGQTWRLNEEYKFTTFKWTNEEIITLPFSYEPSR